MSLISFLQSAEGENSSKRLAFLTGHLFITGGFFWLANTLIKHDKYDLAVDLYNSYLIYCTILGGFVTADIVVKVLQIIRGKK